MPAASDSCFLRKKTDTGHEAPDKDQDLCDKSTLLRAKLGGIVYSVFTLSVHFVDLVSHPVCRTALHQFLPKTFAHPYLQC